MRGLLEQTAERAITYLEGVGARGVAPTEDAITRLDAFDQPLPDRPADPAAVLRLLDEIGSPATIRRPAHERAGTPRRLLRLPLPVVL